MYVFYDIQKQSKWYQRDMAKYMSGKIVDLDDLFLGLFVYLFTREWYRHSWRHNRTQGSKSEEQTSGLILFIEFGAICSE